VKILDELRRLHEAEAPEWAVSGHRVFEDNGPWLGDFVNEGPAELAVAARNALPALLRVAEAARNATSLNSLCAELMVKLHGADPTIEDESALNSLYEEEEAAWVELHAALAALETQP